MTVRNRLEVPFDGLLHLVDRQLVDVEGRLLGKVDDVELTRTDEGWTITALLTGPTALLSRLGGRLGDELTTKYVQLRPSEPHRVRPWRVTLDLVDHVDSAVHLRVERAQVLVRDRDADVRLGSLGGMTVLEPDGHHAGHVLDARFEPAPDGSLVLRSLLVGRGGPGSLLGYDRRREQGPWLVARLVRLWHRDTRVVDLRSADIEWDTGQVRLSEPLRSIGVPALSD
jgi:sporulation protein YlmC with PRC-barrel domain